MLQSVYNVLCQFRPISLSEMKAVKLMNRVDTKYLTTIDRLPEILKQLQHNYFVQEINGKYIANYQTLYYDTADVQMYLAHQDGKLNRQKIRTRIYCDSQDAFCEIKNKNNKKRTKKKRIEIEVEQCNQILSYDPIVDFIRRYLKIDACLLMPQVQNQFERITLVNEKKTERLTIDCNLNFVNQNTKISYQLPELVVVELKQDGFCQSYFKQVLLSMRIPVCRISKYCLGTVLTNPNAKHNRYKKKIRYINKLIDTCKLNTYE